MTGDPTDLTLAEAARLLRRRGVSAVELAQAHLNRIRTTDSLLNAFITVDETGTLASAKESDRRLRTGGGAARPLEGCPIALKDNFVTLGLRTTCASRLLADYSPPYEGTPSGRLKAAGAVVLGKCNMDEFGMGSSNEHSAFGPARNPWNLARTPGGSSGGSAAAVAARLCLAATGTDTGGSIRQPAAFCGLVGVKPTYGRISRYGLVAFASSLDQAGAIARTVEDAALLLQAMSGHDPNDATSARRPVPDWPALLKRGIAGMRIGVPEEYFGEGIEDGVRQAARDAIATLAALGAQVQTISLPHSPYAVACYYILAPSEASANLARYDGVRYGRRAGGPLDLNGLYVQSRAEGFGREVTRRMLLGAYCLSAGYYDAYYAKAQKVRTLIRDDFTRAFETVDVIAAPTTPTAAFLLGERRDDPLALYLADALTIPASLAGLPALSVPCGFTAEGLPLGLQLIGKPFAEDDILAAAQAYEQATDWRKRRPEFPA
ncbi:MAG: Asp-tRNA(Asn)/Glu-tRNA(Gln) amidotransferase subunit GatA [Myxococcales bacterium]|nr:MAG: Asp-tRNA(Asn)/Glu-tRNA(Gln) amidotransferase subunit GatA [Myxococcales bacterium]